MKVNLPRPRQEIDFSKIEEVLGKAYEIRRLMGQGAERIVTQGSGFGELTSDTEIKADRFISKELVAYLKASFDGVPFKIEVEGAGVFSNVSPDSKVKYYMTIDPLDGSLNFRLRGKTLGLPYSTAFAVFEGDSPSFKDLCRSRNCGLEKWRHLGGCPRQGSKTKQASLQNQRGYKS